MARLVLGPFEIDPRVSQLRRDGALVDVQPQTVELLAALAERPGEVVSRDALAARLWPDVTVTEHSLTQALYRLRKALGDHAGCVTTVPGRGVRLDAVVVRRDTPDALVGRARDLATLRALAEAGPVWLVGPPGVGKSAVLAALARSLGWPLVDGRAPLPDGPVAVDDAEQLDPATLSGRAGAIVASREAPATGTAHVLAPLGLPVGDAPADIVRSDAGALFLAQARRWAPLDADPQTSPLIRAVCAATDGLPLLIELAAARLRLVPLDRLAAEAAGPEVMRWRHPRRDHSPHHATVATAVEPSLDRLAPDERIALARLTVPRGAVGLDDARALLGGPVPPALARHHLVRGPDDPTVWAGVRAVAAEALPADDPARTRHAERALVTGSVPDLLAAAACCPDAVLADRAMRAVTRHALRAGHPASVREVARGPWATALDQRLGPVDAEPAPGPAWVLGLRARHHLVHGRVDEALREAERALVAAGAEHDLDEAGRAAHLVGVVHAWRGGDLVDADPPPGHTVAEAAWRAAWSRGHDGALAALGEPVLHALAGAAAAVTHGEDLTAWVTACRAHRLLLPEACLRAAQAAREAVPRAELPLALLADAGPLAITEAIAHRRWADVPPLAADMLADVLRVLASADTPAA